jgi:hypothetical protein
MEEFEFNETPSIHDYVFKARETTAADFRKKNEELIEETLSELNALYSVNIACIHYGANFSNSHRFDGFSIFFKALETLVSAFHMASHRQVIEAFALIRLALENAASAFHISKSEAAFKSFWNLTYHSTTSISNAKKIVPIIGELWGALSIVAIHTNLRSHGPKYQESEDGKILGNIFLYFFKKEESPGKDEILLLAISLAACIVHRFVEETLFEKSETHEGWLQLPGTLHLYKCPTDNKIQKYYKRFIEMPDKY